MSQTITKLSRSTVINQLDTYFHTTLAATMYTVEVSMTDVPPSSLLVAIQQNGSTKLTSTAESATQNHTEARVTMNCAIGDTLTIVVSSTAPIDSQLNNIKGIINIRQGSV